METSDEKETKKQLDLVDDALGWAIKLSFSQQMGVLDSSFLCKSLSVLGPKAPVCVSESEPLGTVMEKLREKNISSILIVDKTGKLVGIFTERDCIRKALLTFEKDRSRPVSDFMTRNPVTQPPTITVAFALNLMSHGGFRHIPLVDVEDHPVGIVSVRDVVDYLVHTMVEDLLNFKTV